MSQPVWTWARIQREWLGDAAIGVPQTTAIDAFNRVERLLGAEWLSIARPAAGTTGSPWTLRVVSAGILLGVAERLSGGEVLIAEARAGAHDVWPELEAIELIHRIAPHITMRVRPKVSVHGKEKIPDFAARDGVGPMVYIEVSAPEYSLEHRHLQARIGDLAALVRSVPGIYALEVFLRRAPTDPEFATLASRIRQLATVQGVYEEELPAGLGRIFLNHRQPTQLVMEDHGEPTDQPRLSTASAVTGGGEARDIVVRVPYTDDRADRLLRREARQLPEQGPGIVMFSVHHAQLPAWAAMIERRFVDGHHTRVSAACLFAYGLEGGAHGEESLATVRLVRNPNAKVSLPLWAQGLRRLERGDGRPALIAVTRRVR